MSNNEMKSDQELDDILSNALEDFIKPEEDKKNNKPTNKKAEEEWSEEYFKNAAVEFEKNIQTLLNDEINLDDYTPEKLTEQLQHLTFRDGNKDDPEDFGNLISETIKNLSELGNQMDDKDIPNLMSNANLENSEFYPLMEQVMESLLSKEILYPALKDILKMYPNWLEEKRNSLSDSEFQRYSKQLELMKSVCGELEKESSDENQEVKKKRYENILSLMLQMQECGQPPQELMSEYNAPFNFNALSENSTKCNLM